MAVRLLWADLGSILRRYRVTNKLRKVALRFGTGRNSHFPSSAFASSALPSDLALAAVHFQASPAGRCVLPLRDLFLPGQRAGRVSFRQGNSFVGTGSIPRPRLCPRSGAVTNHVPDSLTGRNAPFDPGLPDPLCRHPLVNVASAFTRVPRLHFGTRDPRHPYAKSLVVPIFPVLPIRLGSSLRQPPPPLPEPGGGKTPRRSVKATLLICACPSLDKPLGQELPPLPMRFAYPEPPRPGKPRQISSCPRVLRPGVACNLFFRKC